SLFLRPSHRIMIRPSLSLFCFALLSTTACSDRGGTRAGGDTGGTMVITYGGGADNPIFPAFAAGELSRVIGDQIYERLAEPNMKMNTIGDAGFEPRLAKSWTWSPDSLSIAFSLDPRARWHDGQPVRAADVAYTFAVN